MRRECGILGAVTATHAAVGIWVATAVPGPLLAADDLAYLGLGRTIAGEGAAPLGAQPPYGVLYPILLAPGWLLGLDEGSMLSWARVVNALLGAALIPVLFALVRKTFGIGFGWGLTVAVIGSSLPAHMVTGSIVWTERLLALLVAVAALALAHHHERPSLTRGLSVAALAMALFATHPRMGLAGVVALVGGAWIARSRPSHAVIVAAVGAGGIAVAEWLRRTVAVAAFASTGSYDAGDLASRRGLGEVPEMVSRGTGTLAHLVLATAGLAVVGLVILARDQSVGRWIIAMLAATVAVAGWFLTGVERADATLHGRYIEVFAPVLVALGLVGLHRSRPWRLLAVTPALIVVAGLFGAWAGPGNNWNRPRSPVMMLGTEAGGAPFGNDIFEPGAAALVALVAGGLLLAGMGQGRPWIVLGTGIALVGVGTASSLEAVDQLYDSSVASEVEAALADVDVGLVVIDTVKVPPNVSAAVAWEIGFDHATTAVGSGGTHMLLPAEVDGPPGGSLVAEVGGAALWEAG